MKDDLYGVGMRVPVDHTLTIRSMDDRLIYTLDCAPSPTVIGEVCYTVTRDAAEMTVDFNAIESGIVDRLRDAMGDHYKRRDGTPLIRNPDGSFREKPVRWRFRMPPENQSFLTCTSCRSVGSLSLLRYPTGRSPAWVYQTICRSCGHTWDGESPPVLSSLSLPEGYPMPADALEEYGEWVRDA